MDAENRNGDGFLMVRLPRLHGTLQYIGAWLTPWRQDFSIRAHPSGLEFHAHHRDVIGRHLAKYGTHEPELTDWIAHYLKTAKPGLYVDVGANLGWHAVHAALHVSVEAIVAFEPDPFNIWLLHRNLSSNGIEKAVVSNSAIGAKSGQARLHSYKSSNRGRHSLLADYGHGSLNVPLSDLDSALDRLGLADKRVSLIKIDVEGYEPAVIEGATQTLARTETVVMELSPQLSEAGALPVTPMIESLLTMGFAAFSVGKDRQRKSISTDQMVGLQGQLDVLWMRPEAPN